MTSYDVNRANEKFIQIAKKYSLNPLMLKEIMLLRNRGMNNAEIALQLGINRNTVNKYVKALTEMDNEDFLALIALVAIIGAGAILIGKIIDYLIGGENDDW